METHTEMSSGGRFCMTLRFEFFLSFRCCVKYLHQLCHLALLTTTTLMRKLPQITQLCRLPPPNKPVYVIVFFLSWARSLYKSWMQLAEDPPPHPLIGFWIIEVWPSSEVADDSAPLQISLFLSTYNCVSQ